MTSFFQQVSTVFKKDLLCELREAHHLLSVFLFGVLLLLLFSFALSVEPDLVLKMAPGLFWLAILFASILALHHSFRREIEDHQWEGLLLMGCTPKAFYLGKLLSNLLFLFSLEIILLMTSMVLFDLPLTPALVIILGLGSLGIATLGTFYAGMTMSFQEGQLLLPLLLFPMLVPLLLAAVQAMHFVLVQDVFGQQNAWLKLLIVFDTVFLLGSLLMTDIVFESS